MFGHKRKVEIKTRACGTRLIALRSFPSKFGIIMIHYLRCLGRDHGLATLTVIFTKHVGIFPICHKRFQSVIAERRKKTQSTINWSPRLQGISFTTGVYFVAPIRFSANDRQMPSGFFKALLVQNKLPYEIGIVYCSRAFLHF